MINWKPTAWLSHIKCRRPVMASRCHSGRFGSAQALVLQLRLCTDPLVIVDVGLFHSITLKLVRHNLGLKPLMNGLSTSSVLYLLLEQGTVSRFTKSHLLPQTNEVTLRSKMMSYVSRKPRQSGAHKFTTAVSFHTHVKALWDGVLKSITRGFGALKAFFATHPPLLTSSLVLLYEERQWWTLCV